MENIDPNEEIITNEFAQETLTQTSFMPTTQTLYNPETNTNLSKLQILLQEYFQEQQRIIEELFGDSSEVLEQLENLEKEIEKNILVEGYRTENLENCRNSCKEISDQFYSIVEKQFSIISQKNSKNSQNNL